MNPTDRQLNLPPRELPTRINERGELQVFDSLRRRWVALTPEEHVRQLFTAYLIEDIGYPAGRLGNEVGHELNSLSRRSDTVVYGDKGEPLAIVEYKAPEVKITGRTFEQVMRYALALRARWIMLSNGLTHYCAEILPGTPPRLRHLDHLPSYGELLVNND